MRPFAVRSGVGKVSVVSYSIDEVAKEEGVHRETVLTWIRNEELGAYSTSESPNSKRPTLRVTEEALAAFRQRRSKGPTPIQHKATVRKAPPVAGRDYVKHYEE